MFASWVRNHPMTLKLGFPRGHIRDYGGGGGLALPPPGSRHGQGHPGGVRGFESYLLLPGSNHMCLPGSNHILPGSNHIHELSSFSNTYTV